ncbi:MAG TPA: phospholipase D family protein [Candidatus Latescibacteria bacterium]|nr:phospholipase D family protein [Candidatus Latescibacterota bacterium]
MRTEGSGYSKSEVKSFRKYAWLILPLLSLIISCSSSSTSDSPQVEVHFSPGGGSEKAILTKLDNAAKSIDVAMYAFTSRQLAWSLVRAHQRGIRVRVLLDGEFDTTNKYSKGTFLTRRGIDVRIDRSHITGSGESEGHMHHKFAIIDGRIVITGSYNWTASAERRNDENLIILTDFPELTRTYEKNFEKLWQRAGRIAVRPPTVLSATDLRGMKRYVGKEVIIRGKVYDVYHSKKSNTFFLHFDKTRPCFTAVIFSSGAERFKTSGVTPEEYAGKEVEVAGRLVDHPRYGLEIILEDPTQIKECIRP